MIAAEFNDIAPRLSDRQRWVLALLATYRSYAEIAGALDISRNTMKTHTRVLYDKLGVTGRSEAIERGVELGLITAPVSVPLPFDNPLLIELALRRRTFADAARVTKKAPRGRSKQKVELAPDVLA